MEDRLSQFNRKNIRVLSSIETGRAGKGNTIKMRIIQELEVSTPAELEEMLQNPLSRAMAEKFLSNDPTSVAIDAVRGSTEEVTASEIISQIGPEGSGPQPDETVLQFLSRTIGTGLVTRLPAEAQSALGRIVPIPS